MNNAHGWHRRFANRRELWHIGPVATKLTHDTLICRTSDGAPVQREIARRSGHDHAFFPGRTQPPIRALAEVIWNGRQFDAVRLINDRSSDDRSHEFDSYLWNFTGRSWTSLCASV